MLHRDVVDDAASAVGLVERLAVQTRRAPAVRLAALSLIVRLSSSASESSRGRAPRFDLESAGVHLVA